MHFQLLVVLALASVAAAANTTRCFECTDVPDPYDCLKTTTCAPEQICVVEQFTSGGLVLYNSGCQFRQRCSQPGKRNVRRYSSLSKRADIITCDECCSTDFCNDQGCGKAAPKQPARGPTCFTCDVESDPKSCRTIAHCDFGKVCMLRQISHTGDGHHMYRTTCQTPQVCYALHIIGRKRYNYCLVCCHDDFCNDVC